MPLHMSRCARAIADSEYLIHTPENSSDGLRRNPPGSYTLRALARFDALKVRLGAIAQDFEPHALLQVLQNEVTAVTESDRVTVLIRFGAQLRKLNLLYGAQCKPPAQRFGYCGHLQDSPRRQADRADTFVSPGSRQPLL